MDGKLKRGPVLGGVPKSRRLVNNAVKKLRGRTPEAGRYFKDVPSKNAQLQKSDNRPDEPSSSSSLDRNGPKLVSTAQHSNLEDRRTDDDGIYTINLPYCDVIPVSSSGSLELESGGTSITLTRRKFESFVESKGKPLTRRNHSDLLIKPKCKCAGTILKSKTSSEEYVEGDTKPRTRRNYSDLLRKSKSSKGVVPDLVTLD